jgi:hypothetical protein
MNITAFQTITSAWPPGTLRQAGTGASSANKSNHLQNNSSKFQKKLRTQNQNFVVQSHENRFSIRSFTSEKYGYQQLNLERSIRRIDAVTRNLWTH